MKIAVITIAYNEELILPYFIRHYKKLTDTIIVYDNGSTDRTAAIAWEMGAQVIPFDKRGWQAITDLRGEIVKTYKDFDWIIQADADELLQLTPEILTGLDAKGIAIAKTRGKEMFSETLPTPDGDINAEINKGVDDAMYDKYCLIAPKRLTRFLAGVGLHYCKFIPVSAPVSDREVVLKHFKYIGNLSRILTLYADKKRYTHKTSDQITARYNELKKAVS